MNHTNSRQPKVDHLVGMLQQLSLKKKMALLLEEMSDKKVLGELWKDVNGAAD